MRSTIARIIVFVLVVAAPAMGQAKNSSSPTPPVPPDTPPLATTPEPSQPAADRNDPFAPSDAMRERAAVADSMSGSPASGGTFPVLQGVLVRGRAVLACFRIGTAYVVIEPGAVWGAGAAAMTFVSFENDVARLRDAGGKSYEVRVTMRAEANPPKSRSEPSRPEGDV